MAICFYIPFFFKYYKQICYFVIDIIIYECCTYNCVDLLRFILSLFLSIYKRAFARRRRSNENASDVKWLGFISQS